MVPFCHCEFRYLDYPKLVAANIPMLQHGRNCDDWRHFHLALYDYSTWCAVNYCSIADAKRRYADWMPAQNYFIAPINL